ncbi:hypothetical protein AGABI2DRAFT_118391 [Agaricus bisporus var. bisporus H97]|uniref:hypothetical protein n=1 Tax=Agaricus bisporus var. bisporus (strain H97 / ATCC MYA-4626 / FGSC 10389) TaxID=936046 RepID=UPI00029F7C15|nr:hypothetical protein AGABI2DRAFT_118391 [Agaricus bisporus var. bisporus H97]EKV47851.1 hypothetical protein AGABI2DRAFT_118391 [Agaricus bisporus var. bisporus H97]
MGEIRSAWCAPGGAWISGTPARWACIRDCAHGISCLIKPHVELIRRGTLPRPSTQNTLVGAATQQMKCQSVGRRKPLMHKPQALTWKAPLTKKDALTILPPAHPVQLPPAVPSATQEEDGAARNLRTSAFPSSLEETHVVLRVPIPSMVSSSSSSSNAGTVLTPSSTLGDSLNEPLPTFTLTVVEVDQYGFPLRISLSDPETESPATVVWHDKPSSWPSLPPLPGRRTAHYAVAASSHLINNEGNEKRVLIQHDHDSTYPNVTLLSLPTQ